MLAEGCEGGFLVIRNGGKQHLSLMRGFTEDSEKQDFSVKKSNVKVGEDKAF